LILSISGKNKGTKKVNLWMEFDNESVTAADWHQRYI